MNELQNDEILDDDIVEQEDTVEVVEDEIADHEDGADLATDSEGEHEENASLDEESQEAVNKRIGKLTFEKRQAEREKLELAERLKALEEQYKPKEPETPTPPDPFADDYDEQMAQYNEKMRQRIAWETEQRYKQEQQQQLQVQQRQQQLEQVQKQAGDYASNAEKLGVDKERLAQAGNTVAQYGLNNDVAMAILADEQGPLITDYLASNVAELDQVVRMPPVQAALYIESRVKPKLQQLKPKPSNTPKPPSSIASTNVDKDAGKYKVLDGAKFE